MLFSLHPKLSISLWGFLINCFCPDDINSPTRMATIQGPPEQVQRASQMIREIVEQV